MCRTFGWELYCVRVLAVHYNSDSESTYATKKMTCLVHFFDSRWLHVCCEWLTHLNSCKRGVLYIYLVIHMCYCSYFNNFMAQTCWQLKSVINRNIYNGFFEPFMLLSSLPKLLKGLVACCLFYYIYFYINWADTHWLYKLLVEYPLVVLMASAR
jgi:hypothetical protein